MKFSIYKVHNGFLLNVIYSKTRTESYIFTDKERMTMLAMIDRILGEEPSGSVGMDADS